MGSGEHLQNPRSLIPEAIGRSFCASPKRSALRSPYLRFTVAGLGIAVALAAIATARDVLFHQDNQVAAFTKLRADTSGPREVALALLEDPVGLILIFAALVTPILVYGQIRAAADYVPMLERNGAFLTDGQPDPDRIARFNLTVAVANRWIARVGERWVSAGALFAALATTISLFRVATDGLLESWSPTDQEQADWADAVYRGWWASWSSQRLLSVMLLLIVTYGLYALVKQLLFGAVFTWFALRTHADGVGVTPSLDHNPDGYFGLRVARRFIQITYVSAITHAVMYLGVFVFWLPVRPWTFLGLLVLVLTSVGVVIVPTVIARNGVIAAKQRYAAQVIRDVSDKELTEEAERARKLIDEIWDRPNLPFRLRESVVAIATSILVPVALVLLNTSLG